MAKAYKIYCDAKEGTGYYTNEIIAGIIDCSISKYQRQISLLKTQPEKCCARFLHLLCIALNINSNEFYRAIESELSAPAKAQIKVITDFIAAHEAKKQRLTEKQRTAFYPTPLPKSFLQITPERLS